MPIQIVNLTVTDTKMIDQVKAPGGADLWNRFDAILSQIKVLPLRSDAFEAVVYDEAGLPK